MEGGRGSRTEGEGEAGDNKIRCSMSSVKQRIFSKQRATILNCFLLCLLYCMHTHVHTSNITMTTIASLDVHYRACTCNVSDIHVLHCCG